MDLKALIKSKDEQKKKKQYIQFSERELEKLRPDEAEKIVEHFRGNTLIRLPESEIKFFEWLKEADEAVWNDLWQDDQEDESYLVSVDFLMDFIRETPSFPICDLIDEPNYWFTFKHIKPEGLEYLQEEIRLKVETDQDLSLEELFLLEISVSPTDIWHFSHRHQVPVERMKQAIADMVYKGWIVHLTDRDDLVKYLE